MVCEFPSDPSKDFTVEEKLRKPMSLEKCREQVACAGSEVLYQEIEKLHKDIEIIRAAADRLLAEKSDNAVFFSRKIEKLEKALEFYANRANYEMEWNHETNAWAVSPVIKDLGQKAMEALGK